MAEIATWSMIDSKTGYGSSGSYCPTKSEILSYNRLYVEGRYSDNQLVQIDDVRRKTIGNIYILSIDNNNGWLTVADNALDRKSQLSVTYTLRYNGKILSNTKVMYTNVHSFMVYFTANTFESFIIDSVSPTEDDKYIYVIGKS
jgi:hypothetical protein